MNDYCPKCGEIETACNCPRPSPHVSDYERQEAEALSVTFIAIPGHREHRTPEADPPRYEVLSTGEKQLVMSQTPPRKVPSTGLKAKAKQNEKPTVLELYEEILTQPKLF